MTQEFDFRSGKTLNTKLYSDKGILLHESNTRALFSMYDNRRMLFGGILDSFKNDNYNRDFHLPGSKKLDFQGIHDNHKLKLSNKRGIQLLVEKESNYYKPDGTIGYTSLTYGFHLVMSDEVKAKRKEMLANSNFSKDTATYYVSSSGIYQFFSSYASSASEHLKSDVVNKELIILSNAVSKIID